MGQAGKILRQGGRVVCYGMYVLLRSFAFIYLFTVFTASLTLY